MAKEKQADYDFSAYMEYTNPVEVAVLDRGISREEGQRRFRVVEGIKDDGAFTEEEKAIIATLLQDEAVANGAVRIPKHHCVNVGGDITADNLSSNDSVTFYKQGTVIKPAMLPMGMSMKAFDWLIHNNIFVGVEVPKQVV